MPSTSKTIVFGAISVLISIVATLIAAELLLRLLPYNEGLRAEPVTAERPVFRFEPNRTATMSEDWNFHQVNRVRVNNDGFVNNADYDATQKTPLMAIVGDSYIEAVMVPFADTVQGRLAASLKNKGRVYSFGASGSGLSQYLIWAKHARDTYHPDLVVINVIPNDFGESLHKLEHSPGFWRFDRNPDGKAEWRLTEYRPSLVRRVLRRSALAMYLIQNVKIQYALKINVQNLSADDKRWVGNIEAVTPDERMNDYRWAADRFFDFLPDYAGVPPGHIVLAFDGFRPQMYQSAVDLDFARKSTWGIMRAYMMQKAAERGVTTIDLDPPLRERYQRDHQRFEFPTDSHWNGLGHQVFAEQLARTKAYQDIFGATPASASAR